jgi:hypothetical protein
LQHGGDSSEVNHLGKTTRFSVKCLADATTCLFSATAYAASPSGNIATLAPNPGNRRKTLSQWCAVAISAGAHGPEFPSGRDVEVSFVPSASSMTRIIPSVSINFIAAYAHD